MIIVMLNHEAIFFLKPPVEVDGLYPERLMVASRRFMTRLTGREQEKDVNRLGEIC